MSHYDAQWHADEATRLARKAQLFARISMAFAVPAVLIAIAGAVLRLIGGAA